MIAANSNRLGQPAAPDATMHYLKSDIMVPQPSTPVPASSAAVTDVPGALALAEAAFHAAVANGNSFPATDVASQQLWNNAAYGYFAVYDMIANQKVTDMATIQNSLKSADGLWATANTAAPSSAAASATMAAKYPNLMAWTIGGALLGAGAAGATTYAVSRRGKLTAGVAAAGAAVGAIAGAAISRHKGV